MATTAQSFVTELEVSSQSSPQMTVTQNLSVSSTSDKSTNSLGQSAALLPQAGTGTQYVIISQADPGADSQVGETVQIPHTLVYPANNQQGTYSQEYTQYSSGNNTYYQANSTTQISNVQGQIINAPGTFLVQTSNVSDADNHQLQQHARASPATQQPQAQQENGQRSSNFDAKYWQREVHWLVENYECAEGVSLPRSTLYNHYLRHCQEQKMDPMNPASFGKLIRSVFLGLRTRRLGTRGNSKYHYYGIRIKASSSLNQYSEDQTMALRQQPLPGKRVKGSGDADMFPDTGAASQQNQHQQFLGDASGALPEVGSIMLPAGYVLPDNIVMDDISNFEDQYREHCEAILELVVNLQFSLVETLWQAFWRSGETESIDNSAREQKVAWKKLILLSEMEPVLEYVKHCDYAFYQALVEVLIPDVLRPIPSSLTQHIRNFARNLESWLKTSMADVPESMVKIKISAVCAFAQTLRRYTSLNHLAQAARAVLQNPTQISQMLADLNRVDFANVQEQASWVCQCEDSMVQMIEKQFKKTLQEQNTLEEWATWLDSVVQQVLITHEGKPQFAKAARQFLLKWSFYSSMVIRDLTLRSAASFGSFHLIRLLYDEYMFYLIEHKVSNATGSTPIAVMGQVKQQHSDMMTVAISDLLTGSGEEDSLQPPILQPNILNTAVKETLTDNPSQIGVLGSSPSLSTLSSSQSQSLNMIAGTSAQSLAMMTSNNQSQPITMITTGSNAKTIMVVPVSANAANVCSMSNHISVTTNGQPSLKKMKL